MNTTHAALGAALAVPLATAAPELAVPAALAGFAGGVFPDLDLVRGDHRRTLHFPVYYSVAAVAALAAAALNGPPTTGTVAVAFFLSAAALHSVTDVFGGGLELRPWNASDDRGVYVHALDKWLPPKRWIRYDGAPEDFVLAVVLSVPGLLAFDGVVRTLLLAGLVVSAVYTAIRKRLPDLDVPVLR